MDFQDSLVRVHSVCITLIALVLASPAMAEQGKLRERLTPEVMAVWEPMGPILEDLRICEVELL